MLAGGLSRRADCRDSTLDSRSRFFLDLVRFIQLRLRIVKAGGLARQYLRSLDRDSRSSSTSRF